MTSGDLSRRLEAALDARAELFDARRETAFRLFNGFLEGCPEIVVDLYGSTAVLHNYADPPSRPRRSWSRRASCCGRGCRGCARSS